MDKGKIVQFGDALTLYQQPNSHFVAEFLGKVNYLPCQIQQLQLDSAFGLMPLTTASYADGTLIQDNCNAYLLLRPEEIVMQGDMTKSVIADQQRGSAVATVKQVGFLGGYYRYQVELKNALYPAILVIQAQQYFAVGSDVVLSFNSPRQVLFATDGVAK